MRDGWPVLTRVSHAGPSLARGRAGMRVLLLAGGTRLSAASKSCLHSPLTALSLLPPWHAALRRTVLGLLSKSQSIQNSKQQKAKQFETKLTDAGGNTWRQRREGTGGVLARIVSRSVTTSPPAPPPTPQQVAARSLSNRHQTHRHHRSLLTAERGGESVAYACTHTPAAPLASAEHTSPDPHFDSWHGIPNPPHASPSFASGTHCFASEHGTAPAAETHRAIPPSRAHVVPNAQQPGSASHRSPGFTRLRHSRTAGAAVAGAVPGRHIVYAGSHHVPSTQHVAFDPAHRCHAATRDVHTTGAGGDGVSAGTHCAYHSSCTLHR
eukprot:Rhum_TRINITY_DN15475_c0_g2::Rhum_TRINITY_DN15475_c0_g2_i1::g.158511::m.158511